MLIPYDQLLGKAVMSLQTGGELARVKHIVIDPRNLTIVAYELDGRMLDENPSFLRIDEVRELSTLGFIVDSSEDFIGLGDVIKIKEIYEFNFDLVGLEVVEQKGTKLGKVHSYTVDPSGYAVQQIMVRRPLLKSFTTTELIIHRSQIVTVSNDKITVRSTAPKEEVVMSDTIRGYANPFRQSTPAQPDTVSTNETEGTNQ